MEIAVLADPAPRAGAQRPIEFATWNGEFKMAPGIRI